MPIPPDRIIRLCYLCARQAPALHDGACPSCAARCGILHHLRSAALNLWWADFRRARLDLARAFRRIGGRK